MFGGCGEKGWSRKTSEKGGFLKEEEKFPKQTEGGQGSENSTCEGMAVTEHGNDSILTGVAKGVHGSLASDNSKAG